MVDMYNGQTVRAAMLYSVSLAAFAAVGDEQIKITTYVAFLITSDLTPICREVGKKITQCLEGVQRL